MKPSESLCVHNEDLSLIILINMNASERQRIVMRGDVERVKGIEPS